MRHIALACLTLAVLAGASTASACVPPLREGPSAEANARAASVPTFAPRVRDAHEIFLARIDDLGPAPITVIPEPYRAGDTYWWPEGLPARYRFTPVRTLKGAPPATFEFSTRSPDSWPVSLPDDEDWRADLADEDDPAYWHFAGLGLGYPMGRGDCSTWIGFPSGELHLVFRDAAGEVTVARPTRPDGPLVRAVEAALRDPAEPYPHRQGVADYLKAAHALTIVEVVDCRKGRVRVLEALGRQRRSYWVTPGETYEPYGPGFALPPLTTAACVRKSRFLAEGAALHPIRKGLVIFQDRFLQMRFTGPTVWPLAKVRTLAAER